MYKYGCLRLEESFRELTRLCVRGGEWSSPVLNKPYGFCGRLALLYYYYYAEFSADYQGSAL